MRCTASGWLLGLGRWLYDLDLGNWKSGINERFKTWLYISIRECCTILVRVFVLVILRTVSPEQSV